MNAEAALRAVLLAHAPLLAAVPAARICIDAVPPKTATPYIAFSLQNSAPEWSSNNTPLGEVNTIDVQVVGGAPDLQGRSTAIAVRELVKAALLAGGQPWAGTTAAYDDALDLEVEVVTVDWVTG